MCIIHKGFRGKRAVLSASILGGKLISLKPAIPYEIIHSPLAHIDNHTQKILLYFYSSFFVPIFVQNYVLNTMSYDNDDNIRFQKGHQEIS